MLNAAIDTVNAQESHPRRPMRILVLDDSEIDRQRLLRLCDDAGLNIVATEVGSLADMATALAAQDFDLVFVDYLLAGEDGLDALRLLGEVEHQSPATIMIAGEGRVDVAVEAMRQGCSDYLTKAELTVEALQKSVATALERQIMGMSLKEEREQRMRLERAVHEYAKTCSTEMRSILANTLRRTRKLRAYQLGEEYAIDLSQLELSIDRLWETLPDFGDRVGKYLSAPVQPKKINRH